MIVIPLKKGIPKAEADALGSRIQSKLNKLHQHFGHANLSADLVRIALRGENQILVDTGPRFSVRRRKKQKLSQ